MNNRGSVSNGGTLDFHCGIVTGLCRTLPGGHPWDGANTRGHGFHHGEFVDGVAAFVRHLHHPVYVATAVRRPRTGMILSQTGMIWDGQGVMVDEITEKAK